MSLITVQSAAAPPRPTQVEHGVQLALFEPGRRKLMYGMQGVTVGAAVAYVGSAEGTRVGS